MGSESLYRFTNNGSDPLSPMAEYEWHWEYGRGDWQTRTYTYTRVISDTEYFYLHAISTAWEGDVQIFRRQLDKNSYATIFN